VKIVVDIPDVLRAGLLSSSCAREYLWVHDIQPILLKNLDRALKLRATDRTNSIALN